MKNLNDKSIVESQKETRANIIDFLRGLTIILMVFFHSSFDLNYFGLIHVDIIKGPFWYFLPRLIVFLFFCAVGMSLSLVHSEKIKWKPFNKRLLKLVVCAGLISLVTYFMFPENWIYFGTLHSIALISLMSLPFLKYPKTSLLIALALFIPSIIYDYNLPWPELSIQSFDYISPFPWVGSSLIGIFLVSIGFHKIKLPTNRINNFLNYLGRHSLVIYLLHQPILFGLTFVIFKIKN
jgi:uncharacterized membrane protein